jgi:hypothetical protein
MLFKVLKKITLYCYLGNMYSHVSVIRHMIRKPMQHRLELHIFCMNEYYTVLSKRSIFKREEL